MSTKNKFSKLIAYIITIMVYFLYPYFGKFILELLNLGSVDFNDIKDITIIQLLIIFVVELLVFIVIFFTYYKEIVVSLKDFKSNLKKYLKYGLKIWFITYVLLIVSNVVLSSFGIKDDNNSLILNSINSIPIYSIFMVFIFSPVVEEMVFRNSLFDLISNKYLYVFVSSVLFAITYTEYSAINALDYVNMLSYVILGVGLCLALIKTKNFIVPMYIHLLHNILSLTIYIVLKILFFCLFIF